jgi:hypothetical protein
MIRELRFIKTRDGRKLLQYRDDMGDWRLVPEAKEKPTSPKDGETT